jgi:hypothetical protein
MVMFYGIVYALLYIVYRVPAVCVFLALLQRKAWSLIAAFVQVSLFFAI